MILFARDALADIERLRSFLEGQTPDATARALSAIWAALDRVENFPHLGRSTEDPEIRQLVIPFGASAYVVRYSLLPDNDILVLRLWHGRERRST
jgi:plasmid stabilization system protein ParE